MVLAFDLLERIARRVEEILVRSEDLAVEGEFDDGLRAGNRVELAGVLGGPQFGGGDVGGDFDHLDHLARPAEDRIVGRLNPDFLAALADPLVFARRRIRRGRAWPRIPGIRGLLRVFGIDEQAVVLSLDFRQLVAERTAEILVGGEDIPSGLNSMIARDRSSAFRVRFASPPRSA